MDYLTKLNKSKDYIKNKINFTPDICIVLGSGLGDLAEKIKNKIIITYNDIPYFPISTVVGHEGRLVIGELGNKKIIAMQGRFHYYEGYNIEDVVLPIRVILGLGVNKFILTNASGGVDTSFKPGDLMLITDHINYSGVNPLIGKNYDELGERFPDMSNVYNSDLRVKVKNISKSLNIDLKEGVYMWMSGPSYETPAEIKMARILGASAVGMSTVPEAIIANHQSAEIIGISCITNMAAGILDEVLTHDDVVKTSLLAKENFEKLIIKILEEIE